MAQVRPFKAVFYNEEKVGGMPKVVAPPYDVISEEEQALLHNLSPYNFTHIDLGKDRPTDDKDNNKYSRAQKLFEEWMKKGILEQDDEPSLYFYKQEYKITGENHTRLGFIGLLQLQDEESSKIFPHENTHAKAVDDRLRLTKALDSNLSCIFVCYSDKQKKSEKIFTKNVLPHKPLFDVTDKDGVRHRVWRLSDPDLIEEINASVAGQNIFIADGHHRYKVAMEYRKQRLARMANVTGKEPFNYVMTYFTNIDSRDLQILPMHRIIKHFPDGLALLEEHFRIDKVKGKEDLMILLAKAGQNEHAFGLYSRDGFRLLRLKNKLLINEFVKQGSPELKSLDANILKYFVFDPLHIKPEDIIYTKDLSQTIEMVDSHQADASFIMNPVPISQLKAIALNGERMPPKTTYFYPKVLSGLTVYKME